MTNNTFTYKEQIILMTMAFPPETIKGESKKLSTQCSISMKISFSNVGEIKQSQKKTNNMNRN